MGALTLEVIHAATGVSIGGNVVLKGTDEDYVHFIYFSLVFTDHSWLRRHLCRECSRQDARDLFVHCRHTVSGHNHRPPGRAVVQTKLTGSSGKQSTWDYDWPPVSGIGGQGG